MTAAEADSVMRYLGVASRPGGSLSDAELLARYLNRSEPAAFADLVRRHGPMVLGVCRRVLRNEHDAEDAFQAVFLVLARKAATIAPPAMLRNWLYGVAYRTALEARGLRAARRSRERQVSDMPQAVAPAREDQSDLRDALDRELSRLPEKYRVPVVLCDLEGLTRREAASRLGWPEGTVAGRLIRARNLLARRLSRAGWPVTAAALGLALRPDVASAMPAPLLDAALGAVTAAGSASAQVSLIAAGVLKRMAVGRLKMVTALVLAAGLLGGSVFGMTRQPASARAPELAPLAEDGNGPRTVAQPAKPQAEPADDLARARAPELAPLADEGDAPRTAAQAIKPKAEPAGDLAWGEAVGGLQCGIGFASGEKKEYQPGDVVKLVFKVRNTTDGPLALSYRSQPFADAALKVTGPNDKEIVVWMPPAIFFRRELIKQTLAAREEVEVGQPELVIEAKVPARDGARPRLVAPPGTYQIFYPGALQASADGSLRPVPTGKLKLVVGEVGKGDKEKDEGFHWGETVNGLQAGVRCQPADRTSYRIGDAIKLVVVMRNPTDKAIRVEYVDGYVYENAPAVQDAAGKAAKVSPFPRYSGLWRRYDRTLVSGEKVALGTVSLTLVPLDYKGETDFPKLFVKPGKYCIGYPGREVKDDRWPSRGWTGWLEIEVRD